MLLTQCLLLLHDAMLGLGSLYTADQIKLAGEKKPRPNLCFLERSDLMPNLSCYSENALKHYRSLAARYVSVGKETQSFS